jgi:hypothetical protein
LVGHAWQAGEHVAQLGERVFAVALARDHDRVDDCQALAGVGVTGKLPVLFADASAEPTFTAAGQRLDVDLLRSVVPNLLDFR